MQEELNGLRHSRCSSARIRACCFWCRSAEWGPPLEDDGTCVQLIVDEMHGDARYFHAMIECLTLRILTGKGREERRMNVQHAIWEGVESGAEQPHESCKTYWTSILRS